MTGGGILVHPARPGTRLRAERLTVLRKGSHEFFYSWDQCYPLHNIAVAFSRARGSFGKTRLETLRRIHLRTHTDSLHFPPFSGSLLASGPLDSADLGWTDLPRGHLASQMAPGQVKLFNRLLTPLLLDSSWTPPLLNLGKLTHLPTSLLCKRESVCKPIPGSSWNLSAWRFNCMDTRPQSAPNPRRASPNAPVMVVI